MKTLHHYDEIGLFEPMRVDPSTGYRYYSFDQLPRLNRILALKDLGFSLEQIARVLDDDLTADQLTGMLRLRRAELAQQVNTAQERLVRVDARLKQILQEGSMSTIDVVLKRVEAVPVAAAREIVPSPELMRDRCNALIDDTCALMDKAGLRTDGTCLAIYHDASEAGIDVEMAFFLEEAPATQAQHGRAYVRELPAVSTMATAVYQGSYDDFAAVGQLHADLGRWIETNGYRIVGPSREIYRQTPQSPGGNGVMEIQFPVEKM